MTDINLLDSINKNDLQEKKFILGTSFVMPAIILVGIFSLLLGAKLYSTYLKAKNEKLIEESKSEMSSLNWKNVDRIVNFTTRMELGLKELVAKENYESYLKELESLMVSGAKVDSLKYSSSGIEIAVSVDNFNTIARQILSFKNSNYFKDLKMEKSTRNGEGGLGFTMKK